MILNLPAGAWHDRLARLERFYDGPIPPPLRRQALAEPSAPDRFEAGRWHKLLGESRVRLQQMRRRGAALSNHAARDGIALALRQERRWMRQCQRRSRTGARDSLEGPILQGTVTGVQR